MYEKLNLLENGMKTLFADSNPGVDENDAGFLDVVFCSVFGAYKGRSYWYKLHSAGEVSCVIFLADDTCGAPSCEKGNSST